MIAHPLQDLAFSPLKLDGKGGGKVFIKDGEWVGKTSPGLLLAIAAAAIALILLLVIVFKLHAFLTLVVVSVLTAVAAGISTDKLYETVMASIPRSAQSASSSDWGRCSANSSRTREGRRPSPTT